MPLGEGEVQATALSANIWESEKGAIMIDVVFQIENDRITASQCIIQKDGAISTMTVDTFKQCFQWDGTDPFWLTESANIVNKPVQLVLANEEYDGKTRLKVKYINPPGGGMRHEAVDKNKFLAKYGAKFRALAGGSTVKAPAAPKPPTPPPAPAPATKRATLEDAWAALCEANPKNSRDENEKLWGDAIQKITGGKGYPTPEQWAKLVDDFSDNLP